MTLDAREFHSQFQDDYSQVPDFRDLHSSHMHWSERLKAAIKRRGWSQAEFARRSGVEYELLRKYLGAKVKQAPQENVERMAAALGVSPLWLERGLTQASSTIQIIGYVGAGETFIPNESAGVLDEIEIDLSRIDAVGAQIRGNSGLPVYRPGEVVVCARALGHTERGFLNQDCIVVTKSGHGYLKKPTRGSKPGTYTLVSYNAEPIVDVQISWAAPVIFIVRQPAMLLATP